VVGGSRGERQSRSLPDFMDLVNREKKNGKRMIEYHGWMDSFRPTRRAAAIIVSPELL